MAFELADPFAGQVELATDLVEGPGFAFEAEPQFENATLSIGERLEGAADLPASERPFCLFERVCCVAVARTISASTCAWSSLHCPAGSASLMSAAASLELPSQRLPGVSHSARDEVPMKPFGAGPEEENLGGGLRTGR